MAVASVSTNLAKAQVTAEHAHTIRVISASQEVDFPDGVRLELEAEADSNITEIKVVYRIAGFDSTVYGYLEFVPDHRVKARFMIPTSGSSYMPSGVKIQYHYVIRDTKGAILKSSTYGLVYRDPRYDWREDRVGFLNVLTHGISRASVTEVTMEVNDRLVDVMEVYSLDVVQPKTAVIFNSRREADRGFPMVSEAARRGHLYAGFAFSEFDLFTLVGLDSDGMVHEISHLLLADAVDNPVAMIPAWLNEGLAMYFEDNSLRRQIEVEKAAREGRLLYLRNMNIVPGRPGDVRLFYAQSWNIVDFMFDAYGSDRMTDLLLAVNEGVHVDDAILDVFGITIDQLERAWIVNVTVQAPLAAKSDLLSIGNYLLIAIVILFSTTVIALQWMIRRDHRSRPDEDLSVEQV